MAKAPQMLDQLKTKHREVARLSFEGKKPADISKQTGVGLQTVYKILRDPICQAYIHGLADKIDKTTLDVRERLMNLNTAALDKFEEILQEDSKAPYSVIASVGKDVLDRTGNKAPDKLDINHTLQSKSDDEIDAQIKALEGQIASIYNADLTSDEEFEDDSEDTPKPTTQINPKTDTRELI